MRKRSDLRSSKAGLDLTEHIRNKRKSETNLSKETRPVRLIGLSDGLFATVLTLLVLDLRIPDALSAGNGEVNTFVQWIGPHLFSYLLTFIVAGTYWQAHHRDFELIYHYDRRLLGYNLLFLLFIGLLPFSTAAVSLGHVKSNAYPFYWAIYSTNIIAAGIMLTLTWNYAASHHLVYADTTEDESRHIALRHIVTPLVFLISIGAEYIFPQAFLGPFTLLLIPIALMLADRGSSRPESETQSGQSNFTELLWRAGSLLPWILMIGLAAWAMSTS
jgi:uncharacterized membrane protein